VIVGFTARVCRGGPLWPPCLPLPSFEPATAPNITIPWKWFGMTTYAPTITDGNRSSMFPHHDSTINPATDNTDWLSTTSPNRGNRSWTQMVTKYDPGAA